jgi:hypothetical protein
MHMLLILLTLCLRKPYGISRLFSIAYAFAGNGCLRHIYPYFLTYRILERYADLRRSLRPPHGPGLIGDIDTLIAATALERNLTVVTIDTDFQRVPNLRVILLSRATMQVLARP